jgi:hypothetical protein
VTHFHRGNQRLILVAVLKFKLYVQTSKYIAL